MKVAISWSGGKDSMLALDRLIREGTHEVVALVVNISTESGRVTMHGVRESLIVQQARSLRIPLVPVYLPDRRMDTFEQHTLRTWQRLHQQAGVEAIVHGDIFLRDVKDYRDRLLKKAGLTGLYPIWGEDSRQLLEKFRQRGYRTVVCAANEENRHIVGHELTPARLLDLAPGTDPCGENGEFHTFCFAGPLFQWPIGFQKGRRHTVSYSHGGVSHTFHFIDLRPLQTTTDAETAPGPAPPPARKGPAG